MIQEAIDTATAELDPTTWGDLYSHGLVLQVSRILARHPQARDMRLVKQDGTTVFDPDYFRLQGLVSGGPTTV